MDHNRTRRTGNDHDSDSGEDDGDDHESMITTGWRAVAGCRQSGRWRSRFGGGLHYTWDRLLIDESMMVVVMW